jgi:hypothetical protein
MANAKTNIKPGMGGSNCGKGRREPTAILKKQTKTRRRRQDRRVSRLRYGDSSMSPARFGTAWIG